MSTTAVSAVNRYTPSWLDCQSDVAMFLYIYFDGDITMYACIRYFITVGKTTKTSLQLLVITWIYPPVTECMKVNLLQSVCAHSLQLNSHSIPQIKPLDLNRSAQIVPKLGPRFIAAPGVSVHRHPPLTLCKFKTRVFP